MQILTGPALSALRKSLLISFLCILFIYGCGGSINPLTWKSYMERFTSPQQLVQPEVVHAFIIETHSEHSDPVALFATVEENIEYKSDILTHASIQHLSTTWEVLQNREDDCDGIAVLMCSLLRNRGYTAYAVMGPTHAWVEYEEQGRTTSIDFRSGNWIVRFNESAVQWNTAVLILSVVREFVFLSVLIGLLLYSYERGLLTRLREFLDYFQYILPLLLIASVATIIILTFWVPGIVIVSITCLVVAEIVARLRRE
ncbi:MAG: transglutaminase domain-containing protein [Theionarchaea archaeon]|nr:transglutaminase domain-containing protein [Theionarchaea archaeon]